MACNKCVTHADYKTDNLLTWCNGCGNYSIWGAVRNALVAEQIAPKDTLFVHDIGCNGNGADKINGYGIKGLHGRAIPLAAGASIANNKIKVIASAGDGAVLAEGISHLIHAVRANYNFTLIIHNNANFALTTGQASPATPKNIKMSYAPDGVTTMPINISQLLIPLEPSMYARGFSGSQKQLTYLIQQGIQHKGLSVIEVLQSCPTYNYFMSNDWYLKHIYDVADRSSYNPSDKVVAMKISEDLQDKIATGIIYKNEFVQPFANQLVQREGYETELIDEVKQYPIDKLLEKFN